MLEMKIFAYELVHSLLVDLLGLSVRDVTVDEGAAWGQSNTLLDSSEIFWPLLPQVLTIGVTF